MEAQSPECAPPVERLNRSRECTVCMVCVAPESGSVRRWVGGCRGRWGREMGMVAGVPSVWSVLRRWCAGGTPVVRRSLGRFVGGWVGVGGDGVARWGWGVTCCLARVAGVVDEKPPSLAQNAPFWLVPKRCVLDPTWRARPTCQVRKRCVLGPLTAVTKSVTAGILFQFPSTQGVNFRKKKPKHFKILEGRPKELLYIYPNK
jgi:hypothetical protein